MGKYKSVNTGDYKAMASIDSNWNVSSSKLEVCYQDKEQKDISGKLSFVNIVREYTLKTIIADAIRAKLFQ